MDFDSPLQRWRFRAREKRFFIYGHGEAEIAHCPNTGSMKGLVPEASHVWVHDHGADSGRKLRYTAEILELPGEVLVGMNTHRANAIAAEAVAAGLVEGLPGEVRREVKLDAHTRFDMKVGETWVEVKNVTLTDGRRAIFPDSVTSRGAKHLRELQALAARGEPTLQLFLVQRADVDHVAPADMIDPAYGAALRAAAAAGVRVAALGCTVTPHAIVVDKTLPVVL